MKKQNSQGLEKSMIARPKVFDDAFVTSVLPYGDSDCIVRMFTKKSGRMTAYFARGFSRKHGRIEAPALASVSFIENVDKMARLTSCDLMPTEIAVFASPKVFGYCAYFAELIEKFLPEEDAAPTIFSLVEESFAALSSCGPSTLLLRSFELRLLEFCGYLPEMPTDADEEIINVFDPLTCQFSSQPSKTSFPFSKKALQLAKNILIAKMGSLNYEDSGELLMLGRIFHSRLKLLGLGPLKTVAFLKQISRNHDV